MSILRVVGLVLVASLFLAVPGPPQEKDSTGSNISALIELAERGDAVSADRLFSSLYRELQVQWSSSAS
jgi:hypothetical protein